MENALIFDFDGLILDTETPEMRVWNELFAQAGGKFDEQAYQTIIGTYDYRGYNPAVELSHLIDHRTTPEEIWALVHSLTLDEINRQPALPGVVELITKAKKAGLKLGIGSSSPKAWVEGHLRRLGLLDPFDAIASFDDVGVSKPAPDIYVKALEKLRIGAEAALVLEDSYNGVLAAKQAGIRVVVVPNPVTLNQDFSMAEEVLPSLKLLDLRKYFPDLVQVRG